jgi:transposase-like protein
MTKGGNRSPEELREELGELRAELGETVEELAHRADVPARLRDKRAEATQRMHELLARARDTLAETEPAVRSTLRERPALVSGIAVALTYLLISLMRGRRRRQEDGDGTR